MPGSADVLTGRSISAAPAFSCGSLGHVPVATSFSDPGRDDAPTLPAATCPGSSGGGPSALDGSQL